MAKKKDPALLEKLLPFAKNEQHAGRIRAAITLGSNRAAARCLGVSHVSVNSAIQEAERRMFATAFEPDTPKAWSEPRTPDELVELSRVRKAQKQTRKERDALIEQLAQEQATSKLFRELTGSPLPPVKRTEFTSRKREATAVALLSDLHVETLVRPEDTPTGNTYTLGIADLRLGRFFAGVEWLIQAAQTTSTVRNLVLWLGGDMITNHLHPDNVETAQLGPAPALLWVQSRIIDGIQRLLDSSIGLERIDIICSVGNHGRTTDKMRINSAADHSWEWVMYQTIAMWFRNEPRIRVLADKSTHQYHTVYRFDQHYHHGHEVRYSGGVGGIMIPMNKAVMGWDRARNCDHHHFAHFHQYLDAGRILVNGSLIGFESYAMSIKASPEVAQQAFYLCDSKRGKTMASPIWVTDPSKERKIWDAVAHHYNNEPGR